MRSAFSKTWLLLPAFALGLGAQEQGLPPDWDVRAILKEISAHAGRLEKLLEQVNPQEWVEKGASDTYVAQRNSAKAQARALSAEALELGSNPERLSLALQTFFRMQALEFMLPSLAEGAGRYGGTGVAGQVMGLVAENGANRERFQKYIVELAAEREQQFRVMDQEAQRCRGFLARQPADRPRKSRRK
jgi:hypothetical protein